MMSLPSRKKKTLTASVLKMVIGIAEQVEGGIHRWCSIELPEFRQYEEEKEGTWKSWGLNAAELRVEQQHRSKVVPSSRFSVCAHETYFTLSETKLEVFLKKMGVKQFGVESWLSACFNESERKNAVKM